MEQRDRFHALTTHVDAAINRLIFHMTDESTPPQHQIRACQVYLDLSIKYQKTNELEQKILDMELQLATTQLDDEEMEEESILDDESDEI